MVKPYKIIVLLQLCFGVTIMYSSLTSNQENSQNCELLRLITEDPYNPTAHSTEELQSKIKNCLQQGANINHYNKDGDTPLSWAIWKNNLKVVEILMNLGANIHLPIQKGQFSLFMIAIFTKNWEAAKMLFRAGANLRQKDGNGNTVLHYLAKNTIDCSDILTYAVLRKDTEIVEAILACNVSINQVNRAAAISQTLVGNENISNLLKTKRASFPAIDHVIDFIKNPESMPNNDAELDAIIQQINLHKFYSQIGSTFLTYAVKNNNLKMTQAFLRNGADINEKVATRSLTTGNYQVQTPLMVAIATKAENLIPILFTDQTDCTITDILNNNSLLHYIARFASPAAVAIMPDVIKQMEKQQQKNPSWAGTVQKLGLYTKNTNGATPLSLAVHYNSKAVLCYFLSLPEINPSCGIHEGKDILTQTALTKTVSQLEELASHHAIKPSHVQRACENIEAILKQEPNNLNLRNNWRRLKFFQERAKTYRKNRFKRQ